MDFGLAKLRGVSKLTKMGSTIGTIAYMSPEQAQGIETDQRTDIFSLGVVMYELFTGQLPFKGGHEAAVMYEIVNVDPMPLTITVLGETMMIAGISAGLVCIAILSAWFPAYRAAKLNVVDALRHV